MVETQKKQSLFGVRAKLSAVIIALVSVIVLMLVLLVAEKNIAIAFSKKEVTGMQILIPLRRLGRAAVQYRESPTNQATQQALRQSLQNFDAGLSRKEDALNLGQQRKAFQQLALQLTQNNALDTTFVSKLESAIVAMSQKVGDSSNLILDPDLDSYYLMDLIVLRLPSEQAQITAMLSELRDGPGNIAHQEKLKVQIEVLRANLSEQRRSLTTALDNNPSKTLSPKLLNAFDQKVRQQERFFHAVELYLDRLAPSEMAAISQRGSESLTTSFVFWDRLARELTKLLQRRVLNFEQRKWGALSIVGGILLAALGFSTFLTRQISWTLERVALRLEALRAGDITRLENGIVGLAEGRRDVALNVKTKYLKPLTISSSDELGTLASSVNQLSNQTTVTIAALSTTRDTLERAETALRESEEQMRYQAFHDPLTRLPNRAYIMEQLYQALESSRRKNETVALLFMDLDNFKVVNDSRGHETGDLLLLAIAQRLKESIYPEHLVARLGGDEFLILMHGRDIENTALVIAERICKALEKPIFIQGQTVFSSASVGIAFSRRGEVSALDVIKHADIAMYRAKTSGKQRHIAFDPAMNETAQRRMQMESDLRAALDQTDQLCLYFQPIYRLNNGALCELEALIRWHHPRNGLILPGAFIPLAEETGLIVPMGEWVLRNACEYAKKWNFAVSINLSLRQLQQEDFLD
jgi:diguanylate cyclase (GGDEF)-like protein